MRYIDRIKTLPNTDANNALILGTAMHEGIENGVEAAIKAYYDSFPIIDDLHVNEVIKLEYLSPRVQEILPKGQYEIKVVDSDFIGFVDLTSKNEEGSYDIYDFKYSNNVKNYLDSNQLHLYKYFYEKQYNKKIRNLYFVFIPKVAIKQKKTEDLYTFRKRIQEELEKSEIKLVQIEFDSGKVIEFYQGVKRILETKDFPKEPNYLCNWCEYQKYCERGVDYMLLPSSERRNIGEVKKRRIWLYGAPFSGKTTMLDQAPNPLNLNTDGNIEFVTMPYIAIKDKVEVEGRMTKRTYAWDVFKDAISELEKKQNDFSTILIDLVEDTREMCRVKMYDDLGIQHESDSGFGKGWDIIKTEYLSTMRRFFNLDYENLVLLSHEDVSKDITKKNGQNITRIAPNIQAAIANKIAGMVDIVARVVVEDDGSRTLNFKSNEVIFGGGRLKGIKTTTIPLSWEALMKVYDEANVNAVADSKRETPPTPDTKVEGSTRRGRKPKETIEPDTVGELKTPEELEIPDDPSKLTVRELRNLAEDMGIDTTDMKKADLIKAVEVESETPNEEADSSTQKVQEDEPKEEKAEPKKERKTRKKRGE